MDTRSDLNVDVLRRDILSACEPHPTQTLYHQHEKMFKKKFAAFWRYAEKLPRKKKTIIKLMKVIKKVENGSHRTVISCQNITDDDGFA